MQFVLPIKLGEYLLAGLPIIGTAGVGPVEPLIEAGVMLPLNEDLSEVWPWVRDNVICQQKVIRKQSHAIGLAHFSLQASVDSYLAALEQNTA